MNRLFYPFLGISYNHLRCFDLPGQMSILSFKEFVMVSTIESENNKLIAQRWLELISENNVEEICRMTAPGWRMHGCLSGMPAGPAGIRKLFQSFGTVEQTWVVEDIIAEGSKVVVRAVNTCTNYRFLNIAGNPAMQVFSAIFIHHIIDGMIVETWRNADDLGHVLKLGARVIHGNLN